MISVEAKPAFRRELQNFMEKERLIKRAHIDGSFNSFLLADFFDAKNAVKKALAKA